MARASRHEAGLGNEAHRKPNTRGKGQSRVCFRGGWVPVLGRHILGPKGSQDTISQEFARDSHLDKLWAGDNDVVWCIWLAVGAEGTEGIMVLLAFVLIWPVPGIYTNYARQITRAEVID